MPCHSPFVLKSCHQFQSSKSQGGIVDENFVKILLQYIEHSYRTMESILSSHCTQTQVDFDKSHMSIYVPDKKKKETKKTKASKTE